MLKYSAAEIGSMSLGFLGNNNRSSHLARDFRITPGNNEIGSFNSLNPGHNTSSLARSVPNRAPVLPLTRTHCGPFRQLTLFPCGSTTSHLLPQMMSPHSKPMMAKHNPINQKVNNPNLRYPDGSNDGRGLILKALPC